MDINNKSAQCHFKDTQVPLKSWDQVFLFSDKGYFKKRKIGNTKTKCLKLNIFNSIFFFFKICIFEVKKIQYCSHIFQSTIFNVKCHVKKKNF